MGSAMFECIWWNEDAYIYYQEFLLILYALHFLTIVQKLEKLYLTGPPEFSESHVSHKCHGIYNTLALCMQVYIMFKDFLAMRIMQSKA
jgi:hypothetical protein